MKEFLRIICLLSAGVMVRAYPSGAPGDVCGSMTPSHYPSNPQMSLAPYSIRVSKSTYSSSEVLTITLDSASGNRFQGFFLQARNKIDGSNIGSFKTISATKIVTPCGGITHTDGKTVKRSVTIEWTAPASSQGSITFYATMVKDKETFWVMVPSSIITFVVISEEGTTLASVPPTTLAGVPPTTLAGVPPTTLASVPPTTTSQVSVPTRRIGLNSTCGITISCFVNCDQTSCYTHVTWEILPVSGEILFHMKSIVSDNANQWMAVGFSLDSKMGEDSVVECVASDGQFYAYSSFNSNYRSNSRENSDPNAVTLQEASLNDNLFTCSVRRKLSTTGNGQTFDIREKSKWFLIFAQGKTNTAGEKKMHNLIAWDAPFTARMFLDIDITQMLGRLFITTSGVNRAVGSLVGLVSLLFALIIY